MRLPSLARRWPLALVLGALAGVILAVALPRSQAEPAAPPAPPAAIPPPRTAAMRNPTGRYQTPLPPEPGTVRILARAKDPSGGPDWAIRLYTTRPRLDAASARLPAREVRRLRSELYRRQCAQLGRIVSGRFGWIDAVNTFRPVGFGFIGAPIQCADEPVVRLTTLVTDPSQAQAAVRAQVAWGFGGRPGRPVTLELPGHRRTVATGRSGVWLASVPIDVQSREVRARVSRPAGGTETIPKPVAPPRFPAFAKLKFGKAVPDAPAALQARAPDPDGALPYGLAAVQAVGGGWCIGQANRVVGDRVGPVNGQLGTLEEYWSGAGSRCPGPVTLSSKRPVDVMMSTGASEEEPGYDLGSGQVARRTLAGRTMFYGTALRSIRTLTFATPRDERTIAPTGPAHAFVVVYDGTFPTGRTTITARFANGASRVVFGRAAPAP